MPVLKAKGIKGRRKVKDFGDLVLMGNKSGVYIYSKFSKTLGYNDKLVHLTREHALKLYSFIIDKHCFGSQDMLQVGNYVICNTISEYSYLNLGIDFYFYPQKRQVLIEKGEKKYSLLKNKVCYFNNSGENLFKEYILNGEI